jgi:hypothetical protein
MKAGIKIDARVPGQILSVQMIVWENAYFADTDGHGIPTGSFSFSLPTNLRKNCGDYK